MKKKKNVTYILVISVALLWGIIIYRIASYTKRDNTIQAIEEKEIQAMKKDTFDFKLKLDYRDPFFEADRKKSNVETEKNAGQGKIALVTEPPSFKFKGIIRNKKNSYAMIESNGNVETLGRQDQFEGFSIVMLKPDSVILEKNGKRFTLKVEE